MRITVGYCGPARGHKSAAWHRGTAAAHRARHSGHWLRPGIGPGLGRADSDLPGDLDSESGLCYRDNIFLDEESFQVQVAHGSRFNFDSEASALSPRRLLGPRTDIAFANANLPVPQSICTGCDTNDRIRNERWQTQARLRVGRHLFREMPRDSACGQRGKLHGNAAFLFSPAKPAGWPISVVPLKQPAG